MKFKFCTAQFQALLISSVTHMIHEIGTIVTDFTRNFVDLGLFRIGMTFCCSKLYTLNDIILIFDMT